MVEIAAKSVQRHSSQQPKEAKPVIEQKSSAKKKDSTRDRKINISASCDKKALKLRDGQISATSSKNNSFFEPPLPPQQYELESGRKKVRWDKIQKMRDIKNYLD